MNLSDVAIERRIYTVRGEQVMIDRDLAELYGVENRTLRQAVRRNIEKFPDDFLYKLSEDESNKVILKGVPQSVIPPGYNTGGMQMYAFTECRRSGHGTHALYRAGEAELREA